MKFGKVLNLYGAVAHSPVVLDAYVALQHGIVEHGTFDGKTQQAIALLVAAVTGAPARPHTRRRQGRRPNQQIRSTLAAAPATTPSSRHC